MINLFENYNRKAKLLEESLNKSGYKNITVVLNDNGYLPSHVVSPIGFFIGSQNSNRNFETKARFFNELSIPYYWEIRGNNVQAEIFEGYKRKGIISYNKEFCKHRIIENVQWLNEDGEVRSIDLYNQYGNFFARKTYSDGGHVLTSYFDQDKKEIILINTVTQTIQLYYQKKEYIFKSYSDFVLFYFEAAGIDTKSIYYNSLSYPFFIVLRLEERYPQKIFYHRLFWQEDSQEIPGNMKVILNSSSSTTREIIVQNKAEYTRLVDQKNFDSAIKMEYLGFIYDIKENLNFKPTIFILTNSDQIVHIDLLIDKLCDYHFVIAAKTEMSQRLMKLDRHKNVKLYPLITEKEINELIFQSSIYLDINRGEQVDDILWNAFLNNLLIFSFDETLHDSSVVSTENCFKVESVSYLLDKLIYINRHNEVFFELIRAQKNWANQASIDDYMKVLG